MKKKTPTKTTKKKTTRQQAQQGGPAGRPAANAANADKGVHPPDLTRMIRSWIVELFHDGDTAYATVAIKGQSRHVAVHDRAFTEWVQLTLVQKGRRALSDAQMKQVQTTLAGLARYQGPEHAVFLRVAPDDQTFWIDLGTTPDQYVHVTAQGWQLHAAAPVRFRRPTDMRALPVPVTNGRVTALRPFVNTTNHGFWVIVAFMLAALRPRGPYPILELTGEMGSAKSTTARLVAALVDPTKSPLRGAIRDEQQLAVAAKHRHLVGLDNLSTISAHLSDSLCRMATGGSYSARKLYSDTDEVTVDLCRPCVINGITALAERSDLADRSWSVELQALSPQKRQSESAYWAALDQQLPTIFGALLDGLVAALANHQTVTLTNPGRLVDAERWVAAAETGLHASTHTFAHSLRSSKVEVIWRVLDTHRALWDGLTRLPFLSGVWQGSVAELHTAIRYAGTPRDLGQALARLGPTMEQAGLRVTKYRQGHTSVRGYRVEKVGGLVGIDGRGSEDDAA